MSTYEFSVPCLFGLEGIAGDELRRLDIPNVRVENGRVLFSGEIRDMAKANICLRTGERVLIVLADFPAKTFEELFQGVYRTSLEDFIPKDGSFPVKGYCLNSQLMSVPDCQAIVKKAEERARILVSDAEIVKAAQQRAAEITAAAQSESRTLRQTVTDYCDNMLKTTEEAMVENAAQVKNVRANLRQNAKKNG